MTAYLRLILLDVRRQLSDPRRWVQGTYCALRTPDEVIPFWRLGDRSKVNCFCLATAISLAIDSLKISPGGETWTEIRSEVERVLLGIIDEAGKRDGAGKPYVVVSHFNDAVTTDHQAILWLVDEGLKLFPEAA